MRLEGLRIFALSPPVVVNEMLDVVALRDIIVSHKDAGDSIVDLACEFPGHTITYDCAAEGLGVFVLDGPRLKVRAAIVDLPEQDDLYVLVQPFFS